LPLSFGGMSDTIDKDPTTELLEALRLAIRAMNATPNFDTRIPNPERTHRTLRSYELLPKLEAVVRKYEGPS
jgi:hypothetical protein